MQLIGFSIAEDCIALERGSDYFDLHNNFDFQGLTYDPVRRTLELRWRRGSGDWVNEAESFGLRLEFSGVYLFKAHERDPKMPFSEDNCLDAIGFHWNNDPEDMGSDLANTPNEGGMHFIARFMSGFCIKIGAESVVLHLEGCTV